ncbi:MAG: heavy-metal-associated domain-containing protein [Muribaculaceae bacterium]|nr:heavy-metal-associated domain-containing protein [Muribaculaceae bacterium]
MKKFILTLFACLFVSSVFAKDIQELVVTTNPPMSCQNCENKIKDNLRFEKGVKKIETNIPQQRVVVTYDADKTNPENIEKAFSKIGYTATEISEGDNAACPEFPEGGCCKKENNCSGKGGACCKSKN